MKIPDYYRQFQSNPTQEKELKPKDQEQVVLKEQKLHAVQQSQKAGTGDEKTSVFQGNGFSIHQLEEWEDKTLYTLTGPVTDGIQHNIILTVEKNSNFEAVEEYAEWQIKTLEDELKGYSLLKKGEIKLSNGTDAYEVVYSWYPVDDFRIYQHQVYSIIDKSVYKMTASFTKKTWKTLGPAVLRMMLSLEVPK